MRSRLDFYRAKARQAERRADEAGSPGERLDYLFVARQWWEVAKDTRYLEQLYGHAQEGGAAQNPLDIRSGQLC
jgi:hypothetical protein